jgi:hypothetical protein
MDKRPPFSAHRKLFKTKGLQQFQEMRFGNSDVARCLLL